MFSSETLVGSILASLGIQVFIGTNPHDDSWPSWSRAHLDQKFAHVFGDSRKTVLVVDRSHQQYLVHGIDEVECVWRKNAILYVLVVPHDVFGKHRGDVALMPIPALEPT